MPRKPQDATASASSSESADTFYSYILKKVAIDTIQGLLTKVSARDKSTSYKFFGAVGLFNSKLSEAKQWAYQAFLLGDRDHLYRAKINQAMKAKGERSTDTRDYGFSDVSFDKLLSSESDVTKKAKALDVFDALYTATTAIIDYFKERSEGHTTQLIQDLKGAANRVYTQCNELGLLDKVFDKTDPLSIYACAALMYLGERDGTSDRLAQAKMELIKKSYQALKTSLEQRREGAKARGETVDECEVVLKEIENVISKHNELCEEYRVAGKLPVTFGLVVRANLPFSLTPGEGSLGEKLGWAEAEIKEIAKARLEAAEEAARTASMTH